MRLFVGLDLPVSLQDTLDALLRQLRPAARLRWSPVENLHITTKFVGEWPGERLEDIKQALQQVRGDSLRIAIRGLGWFPNPHHPRVFFAAVRAPEALAALAAATAEAVARLGVEREKRPYTPHLTLARIPDSSVDLSELRRRVAGLTNDDFGEFQAEEFHLYHSQPTPAGSLYSKLASFPLR